MNFQIPKDRCMRLSTLGEPYDIAAGGVASNIRLCADCKHCLKRDPKFPTSWDCTAKLIDPVDGCIIRTNGLMSAWSARREYCGSTGIYYEPSDKNQKQ